MAAVMRVLSVLVVAGCAQLDPSKPIELVPDPSWSVDDVATLANAAACWNLQFGTQLEIVARPSSAQTVFFRYDVLACWGSWGRYLPGEPTHDAVCPVADMMAQNARLYGYDDNVLLFTVLEHELGHAVGILDTLADSRAVMGANYAPTLAYRDVPAAYAAFSDIDFQLLNERVPSFVARPTCTRVVLALAPQGELACACP